MTDKEKLQKLFQAALEDSDFSAKPVRAFPESLTRPAAPPVAPVVVEPVQAVFQPVLPEIPTAPTATDFVKPMANAGLDEATSNELGALLDQQFARKKKQRRRELIITAVVCFGLTGGGYGWFIQSPSRVTALQEAIKEIKSVGDIKGLVAKYQKALDKIGERSKQIDEATTAMGGDPNQKNLEDIYMEAETEAFTGEKGKSIGARNKMIQEKLGSVVKDQLKVDPALLEDPKAATVEKTAVSTAGGNSFQ